MANPGHSGHAYRRERDIMFSVYGDICHICGHAGARQADYIVPWSRNPGQGIRWQNMRPAHGGSRGAHDNPCPTCGKRCNQNKGKSTPQERAAAERRKAVGKPSKSREW